MAELAPINKKKPSRSLLILGAVVLVAILWYFLFVRSAGGPAPGLEDTASRRSQVPEINFSIFESGKIEEFKSWSVLPLEPPATGRTNPFSR